MPVRRVEELDVLMAQLARGERAVFTRVFELLWERVYAVSLKLLENEADAADAAQEAMQKILERSSEYDARRPAMPWALAIAGWECRTLQRKRARRKEARESARAESDEDAENHFVQRDLVGAAMNALGSLSEPDRDALVATFWDEAASVAGATLRQRRARALTRLRDTFRRLYGLE